MSNHRKETFRTAVARPQKMWVGDEGVGWQRWTYVSDDSLDPHRRVRQVAAIRFCREDGLDPRVCPEDEGTHLARSSPGNQLITNDGRMESSCGLIKRGFTDYVASEEITCPSCCAMLVAMLLLNEAE